MDFVRSFWDIIWEVLGWFQVITFIDEWEEGYWAPDADGIDRIN